jgi:UDP:flavonoid glycosyltransferase YjiC (YdhE family)
MRTELENQKETFQIPDQLIGKPGKLIFVSMGTMCCSELKLMKRLVSILAKSKNRFIVSKGPLGQKYELPDNMWGQNSVKQLQILPIVDLVITHGGNNTVTETLYFGKPMIVLPVFSDQYDTSQRVVEKKLGLRLDPYKCQENDLLEAIETLLGDSVLKFRIENISKRIQSSKSKSIAAQLIENVIIDSESNKKSKIN